MMYGNRGWVRDHPIATKRFLRAMYKADDFCTAEPEIAARQLVAGWLRAALRPGVADHRGNPLRPLARLRFRGHAPVLCAPPARGGNDPWHPNALLAAGTDWRFVDQLKRELRA
jgi:NitT/TauT family transport system substrate-binding protein